MCRLPTVVRSWAATASNSGRSALSTSSSKSNDLVEQIVPSTQPDLVSAPGFNLKHRSFQKDIEQVLAQATGVNLNLRKYSEIRDLNLKLFSTVGVHPHDAKTCNASSITKIRELIEKNRDIVLAVGECGLDFNRNFSTPEQQVKYFEEQVRLACDLQLPLFLHERDAHEKTIEILFRYASFDTQEAKESALPLVYIHCFTGTEDELDTYISRRFYIRLTGFICKKKRGSGVLSFVSKIPRDRLMIETDAPFMAPEDARLDHKYRSRNEPATLPVILERRSEAMNIDVAELAEVVTKNT